MKRLISAGVVALATVTMMGAANAADIARRQAMPTKAPAYYAPYNWTGFYVGINGGGAWGNSDWDAATGSSSHDTSGGLVGGTVGYNYQVGQAVFGIEGDIDWSEISAAVRRPCHARQVAKRATRGSAPSVVVSVTRSIALCLTSPAALRSATSRQTRSVSPVAATPTPGGRLAAAWKRPLPVRGPRRSNICTSTFSDVNCSVGKLRAGNQRRLPRQRRTRPV